MDEWVLVWLYWSLEDLHLSHTVLNTQVCRFMQMTNCRLSLRCSGFFRFLLKVRIYFDKTTRFPKPSMCSYYCRQFGHLWSVVTALSLINHGNYSQAPPKCCRWFFFMQAWPPSLLTYELESCRLPWRPKVLCCQLWVGFLCVHPNDNHQLTT